MLMPMKVIDVCRGCANKGWMPDIIEVTSEVFEECKPYVAQAIEKKLDFDPPLVHHGGRVVGKSRIVDDDNLVLTGLMIRRGPTIRAGYIQGKKTFWEAFE